MTEREVELLGFKREDDENFGENWHYFTYEVAEGLCLTSNSSDEAKEIGYWYVEFEDTNPVIRFTLFEDVQILINKLEKNKI